MRDCRTCAGFTFKPCPAALSGLSSRCMDNHIMQLKRLLGNLRRFTTQARGGNILVDPILHNATVLGAKTAISTPNSHHSYAQLANNVFGMQSMVKPHQTVAMLMPPGCTFSGAEINPTRSICRHILRIDEQRMHCSFVGSIPPPRRIALYPPRFRLDALDSPPNVQRQSFQSKTEHEARYH